MKSAEYKNFVALNLGVLFIATSGVLGRPLEMAPELAIFYRCLLACLLLGCYVVYKKFSLKLKSEAHKKYILLGGILMGIHWITYFYSLSLSSVAIAILTLHIFPAITSILEPTLLGTKFRLYHLALAGLVILGIYVISPPIDLGNDIFLAILFGIASALTYALRNIFTRKVMSNYNGSVMMLYQLVIMTVLLLPYVFIKSSSPLLSHDWPFIIGLALLTTAIGHTLLVHSLKNYSAITVSLISSIIPIYGIIMGLVFLSEVPDMKTLLGGGLIMISFFVEAINSNRRKA